MPKPVRARKSPPQKTPPQPLIIVTGKNAFGWLLSLFVVCGCMFVIGVLVGRGQAPVQFDTHEWEKDLNNLKTSVLAKRDEFRESIENIEIIDYLKEKGKSIQFYKQYIPPVLSPKYGKHAPPPDTAPVAGEPGAAPSQSDQQQLAAATMNPPQAVEAPAAQNNDVSVSASDANAAAVEDAEKTAQEPITGIEIEETAGSDHEEVRIAETDDTFMEDTAMPEPIQQDTPQPIPAADAVIAVKTPATIKPSAKIAAATPAAASATPDADKDIDMTADTFSPSASTETLTVADMPTEKAPTYPTPSETTAEPAIQYAIQVASLREPDKAAAVRDKFRSRGYPAYCQSSEVRGVIWHRVRIGPYPDRHTADQDHMRLREVGVDALVFVLERQSD